MGELAGRSNPIPQPAKEDARLKYVCMPGCPYTGSTLLGFLLNCHPECASIGAATGIVGSTELSAFQCSCGKLFLECEFWMNVEEKTREAGHPVDVYSTGFWNTRHGSGWPRWLDVALLHSPGIQPSPLRDLIEGRSGLVAREVDGAGWRSWALARSTLELTGKSVFVDTARDRKRPSLLSRHPALDIRVIHLIRDVRGNAASILKHGIAKDTSAAARLWKRANRGAEHAYKSLPPGSWIQIRYDDLCADTQATLDRISIFLGVASAQVPADFRSVESHIIGNAMRLAASSDIRRDDSWQRRLSDEDLKVIAKIAGKTNHHFGFDWPPG